MLNLFTFVSSLHMQIWCCLVVQFPRWNGSKQCCCFCPVMRSWKVARKLYKNFRGKQELYNCRLYNEHMGTKLVFIVKFYFKCVSDNGLKVALKIKSLDSIKVLNLRQLEHKFSYSMWFDFIAMWFVSWHHWFSSNMPCKWCQRYHPKSKGDQFTL